VPLQRNSKMKWRGRMRSRSKKSCYQFFTFVPARLDRLPWSSFHWLVVFTLGITWILDGLEVTLTGAISGVLQDKQTLNFSPNQIGLLGSGYVAGAVLGSLIFGYLTDLWGRRKLFFFTLSTYVLGVLLSALSWNMWSFFIFRFITGAGIGGEYAAINSAIDELIPARVRGRVDLIINGSYWIGAALGSLSTIWILNPQIFPVNRGWRIGFAVGAVLGLVVIFLRRFLPESPRWLILKGRTEEAEKIVKDIEDQVLTHSSSNVIPLDESQKIKVCPHLTSSFKRTLKIMMGKYRKRSILGLSLMTAQAFLYNAIFFTYALVLTQFYKIPAKSTGIYLLPFAVGNFMGPLVLGHFFDTIGRRKMICFTYGISGVLLALTGFLFEQGGLTAISQTISWSVVFFFASAAASSAYLTVSEIFPLETRGIAIALFFSLGTGVGGIVAPWLFGVLIGTGSRLAILCGYIFAGVLMLAAAAVEWVIGIEAAGKSLESLAPPFAEDVI